MTIKISLPVVVRDQGSGYDISTTQEFQLTVSQARSLVYQLDSQIPAEEERIKGDKEKRITELKRELGSLQGGSK